MTYKILASASGGIYSEKDSTDSTSHNLGVMEEACSELDCDTVLPHTVLEMNLGETFCPKNEAGIFRFLRVSTMHFD